MKYALLALALVLTGCTLDMDKTYPTELEICAMEPDIFDAELCVVHTDDYV